MLQRWPYVNAVFGATAKVCCLNVHLLDVPLYHCCDTDDESKAVVSGSRAICIVVINAMNLCETTGNKASLVPSWVPSYVKLLGGYLSTI